MCEGTLRGCVKRVREGLRGCVRRGRGGCEKMCVRG